LFFMNIVFSIKGVLPKHFIILIYTLRNQFLALKSHYNIIWLRRTKL